MLHRLLAMVSNVRLHVAAASLFASFSAHAQWLAEDDIPQSVQQAFMAQVIQQTGHFDLGLYESLIRDWLLAQPIVAPTVTSQGSCSPCVLPTDGVDNSLPSVLGVTVLGASGNATTPSFTVQWVQPQLSVQDESQVRLARYDVYLIINDHQFERYEVGERQRADGSVYVPTSIRFVDRDPALYEIDVRPVYVPVESETLNPSQGGSSQFGSGRPRRSALGGFASNSGGFGTMNESSGAWAGSQPTTVNPSVTTVGQLLTNGVNDALRSCVLSSGYQLSNTLASVLYLDCPYVSGTQITSINQLTHFTSLRKLAVKDHDVCSISPLSQLGALEELNLSGNTRLNGSGLGACGLQGLANIHSLKYLFLNDLSLSSLPSFSTQANYTTLSFADNNLGQSSWACQSIGSKISTLTLNLSNNNLNDADLAIVDRFSAVNLDLSSNGFLSFTRPSSCTDLLDTTKSISLRDNTSFSTTATLSDLSDLTLLSLDLSGSHFSNLPAALPTVCVDFDLSDMPNLQNWLGSSVPTYKPRPYTFNISDTPNLYCRASEKFRYLVSYSEKIKNNNPLVASVCPELLLAYNEYYGDTCDPAGTPGADLNLSVTRTSNNNGHVLNWAEMKLENKEREFVYDAQKRIIGNSIVDPTSHRMAGGRGVGHVIGLNPETAYEFRLRRCLVEPDKSERCGGYGPWVQGDYPLTQPLGLRLIWVDPVAGNYQLRWSYPQAYFSGNKPDYFKIAIDGVTENVPSAFFQSYWLSALKTYSNDTIAMVSACKQSGQCGNAASMQITEPPNHMVEIPPPAIVNITPNSGSDVSMSIVDTALATNEVDYFRVDESANGGTNLRTYFIDVSQSRSEVTHNIPLARLSGGDFKVDVRSCVRNRNGTDICSDGVRSSGVVSIPEPVTGFASIAASYCWTENTSGTTSGGDHDPIPDELKLHWDYSAAAIPGQNFHIPSHYEIDVNNNGYYGRFRAEGNAGIVHVEQIGALIGGTPSLGLVPGTALKGEVAGFPVEYVVNACITSSGGSICERVGALDSNEHFECENGNPPAEEVFGGTAGPGSLNPGIWTSSTLPRQGFGFYWASDLRYDGVHPAYGETYDLYAYWATYQMIKGRWSPVWLYAQLKQGATDDTFSGALYYPESGLDQGGDREVGFMQVRFTDTDNRMAAVTLDVDSEGGLYSNGPQTYTVQVINDSGVVNNNGLPNSTDFNNGVWDYIAAGGNHNQDFSVLSWQHNWFEGQVILGFDTTGLPMWANGTIDCRLATASGSCTGTGDNFHPKPDVASLDFHVVAQGLSPFGENTDPNVVVTTRTLGAINRSIPTSVDDNSPQGLTLLNSHNIDIGAGADKRTLTVSPNPSESLVKKAGFHDIRFEITNAATSSCNESTGICTCEAVNGYCDIELTWFSDDDFTTPLAESVKAYVQLNGNPYTLLDSSICHVANPPSNVYAVKDYLCRIQQEGDYRFVLLNRPGTPHEVKVAQSFTLSVSNNDAPEPPEYGNPEAAPTPAAMPSVTEDFASTAISSLAGSFSVDQSGSASYQIPVITAPATAGVAPQVSLGYSSQSANGIAGVGWNLGGTSAIERCGQTYVNDSAITSVQLDDNDRLCLDGQRLIKTNGAAGESYWALNSEYRTEIDTITRVRLLNKSGSGFYFKVWRNDGSVSEYGNTSDSRPMAGSATVYAWLQNRYSDTVNNYIDYQYWHPDGTSGHIEYYPRYINYTGNSATGQLPNAQIELIYQAKSSAEVGTGYLAGQELTSAYRLSAIHSKVRHPSASSPYSTIRYYRLNYGSDAYQRSILTDIRECWDDTDPAHCTKPTTFSWDNNYALTLNNSSSVDVEDQFDDSAGTLRMLDPRFADMNGDGRNDLVYILDRSGSDANGIYIALTQPFVGQSVGVFVDITPANDQHFYTSKLLPDAVVANGTSNAPEASLWQLVDYDADGYQDIVYPGLTHWMGLRWNPDVAGKLEAPVSLGKIRPSGIAGTPDFVRATDYNGDGLNDLIYGFSQNMLYVSINQMGQTNTPASYFDTPQLAQLPSVDIPECPGGACVVHSHQYAFGSQSEVFDYNGDGAVDILVREYVSLESNPNVLSTTPAEFLSEQDLNSVLAAREAQLSNPFYSSSTSDVTLWRVLLSDGNNNFIQGDAIGVAGACNATVPNNGTPMAVSCALPKMIGSQVYLVDVNADALSDVVYHACANSPCAEATAADSWVYRENQGNQLGPIQALASAQINKEAEEVRFVDYNGDGLTDILWSDGVEETVACHSAGPVVNWRVLLNRFAQGFESAYSTPDCVHAGDVDQGDFSLFSDITGDGKAEHLFFNYNMLGELTQLWLQWGQSTNTDTSKKFSYEALNVITKITDGFGAETDIEYKSMVQSSVYTRSTNSKALSFDQQSPVYDLVPGHYVVSRVESSAPNYVLSGNDLSISTENSVDKSAINYHYAGAKIQGNGRGYLGFEQMATFNDEYRILTVSRYHQDYPYVGMPKSTHRYYLPVGQDPWQTSDQAVAKKPCLLATGDCETEVFNLGSAIILSDSSQVMANVVTNTGVVFPYMASSSEKVYSPSSNNQGVINGSSLVSTTVTTNGNYSNYGEVGTISVEVRDASGVPQSIITTTNVYSQNNIAKWFLGRLTQSTVVHTRPDPDSPGVNLTETRSSAFNYDVNTGLLIDEIVEPQSSQYKITTSYTYSDHGNQTSRRVVGSGVDRTSYSDYDSRGRYVYRTRNALNQITSQVVSFDRFGNPLQVKDQQGVTSTTKYDSLGREYFNYLPTGVATESYRYDGAGAYCPANTVYHQVVTSSGQASSLTCFDLLGREIRKASESFSGTWVYVDTHYDFASRVNEVSEPYFANNSPQYWTRTAYDELARPIMVRMPNGGTSATVYDGLITTVVNALGQSRIEERNVMDEIVKITDDMQGKVTFTYDAIGRLTKTDGPLSDDFDVSTMSYNVLGQKISMNDPDKGHWSYDYNALGELLCQRDERGMGVRQVYDDLGRMVVRYDYQGITDLNSCTGVLKGQTNWTYNNSLSSGNIPNGYGQLASTSASHDNHRIDVSLIYDPLGRPIGKSTVIDQQTADTWYESTTYDQYGRVFQQFDASGYDYGIQNEYNARGYLFEQKEAKYTGDTGTADTSYYKVLSTDARGNVTSAIMNGQITTNKSYDDDDGQLNKIMTTDSAGQDIQDLYYEYDQIGNLKLRHDQSGNKNLKERFEYDSLNRMRHSYISINGGSEALLEDVVYDASGSITHKNGALFTYRDTCGNTGNNAGAHALCSANGNYYNYDLVGNMISDSSGRNITYSAFNKPLSVSSASQTTNYWYGAGRQRYLRADTDGATYYIGNVEITEYTDGRRIAKRYLGGMAIHDVNLNDGADSELVYTHRDHLGSMDVTTKVNELGIVNIDQTFSFNAWGERRDATVWSNPTVSVPLLREATPRGFTGHEHIDHAGIIHMNGRIYDAKLGRFLQADPVVQAAENTQNYNRYTYVLNNPLSYTDPSGYFFKSIGKFFKKYGRTLASIAITIAAPQLSGKLWVSIVAGAAAGYVSSGSLKGALIGAFSGAVFHGIGDYFQGLQHSNGLAAVSGSGVGSIQGLGEAYAAGASITSAQAIGKVIAHGATGGVMSTLQGGKFAHGFVSAGITQAFAKHINNIGGGSRSIGAVAGRVSAAALVGGTASELSGGKFVNGAVTGAFSRAFNDEFHPLNFEAISAWLDELVSAFDYSEVRARELAVETVDTITDPGWMVNSVVGFGDGISGAVTLGAYSSADFREDFDISGRVNLASGVYGFSYTAGVGYGGFIFKQGRFITPDNSHKGMGPHLHYGPKWPGSTHPRYHFGPRNPAHGRGRFSWKDWYENGRPWRWR